MKKNINFFLFILLCVIISICFGQLTYAKRNRVIEPKTIYSLGCSNISPNGKIAEIFNIGSDYTDIQREDVLNEIKNDVVCWNIVIYEISKISDDTYKILSNATQNSVGSIVTVKIVDDSQKKLLHSLKTGNTVAIKGLLTGETFMRNLIINPAVLLTK